MFFGGAGVSTESGIPDFRSARGIYNQDYPWSPETIVSHSFFMEHTDIFYRFYRSKMVFPAAKPNITHRKLAELEQVGILGAVVTQNIDGLHQLAGSKKVFELHGSIHRNTCMDCRKQFGLSAILQESPLLDSDGIPHCDSCGGIIKPDVVLYEEPLDDDVTTSAIEAIEHASMLVIGGTSLAVYPAAGMIGYFRGSHLAIINRTPTPLDRKADLCLACDLGKAFDW